MSESIVFPQSTNHILMIEPAEFFANPETMETNVYQVEDGESVEVISEKALSEFRAFRDALVEKGVNITCAKGIAGCPDMVFPNWFFAPPSREFILCPMLNKNRQDERSAALVALLQKLYPKNHDWTYYEAQGRALESTASIVSDHVNRQSYSALSARTDEGLVREWAEFTGYEVEIFQTRSHTGLPVYHTDCVMWIGTRLAGLCVESIVEEDRTRVLDKLRASHDVIEFTNEQLQAFCGNALEVQGHEGRKYLAMSEAGVKALTDEQMRIIQTHFEDIISAPLYTLEKYGGGSARCMLAELF